MGILKKFDFGVDHMNVAYLVGDTDVGYGVTIDARSVDLTPEQAALLQRLWRQ